MKWLSAIAVGACVSLGLLVGAGYAWRAGSAPAPATRWVRVESARPAERLVLDGQLGPADPQPVVVPFDGRIVRRWARVGDRVAAGSPLFELATDELQAQRRDLATALAEAQAVQGRLSRWRDGTEVSAARRQLRAADTAVATARRHVAESQALFERGVVARSELDAAQAELASAESQHESGQDELQSALDKGGPSELRLAVLAVVAKREQLAAIDRRLAGALVRAPADGVLMQAVAGATDVAPREIEVGQTAPSREAWLVVGDELRLLVRAAADEFEVTRLHVGLAASASADAFGGVQASGRVLRVSSAPRRGGSSDAGGRGALFDVEVALLPLAPALQLQVRLGMRVRVEMAAPEGGGPSLFVPLAAVARGPSGEASVQRRLPGTSRTERVPVRLGASELDRVAVTAGLAAGDELRLTSPDDPADGDAGLLPRAGEDE